MGSTKLFDIFDTTNKNIHSMIKMLAQQYKCSNRLITFLLGSNAAVGDNTNISEGTDYSIIKVDTIDVVILKNLLGHRTNTSGGNRR